MNAKIALLGGEVQDLLDLIEIICEEGERSYAVGGPLSEIAEQPIPGVETEINDLFDRHRLGYRLEFGEIRKVGSDTVV